MLYTDAITEETFELLKTLMQDEQLSGFKLAGGTSLALYLGHRKSADFDLFTEKLFDASSLEKHLIETYDFKGDFLEKNTVRGSINDIKVDCISHNFPYVEDPLTTKDGVRLYGIKDIAAMKLSAIADDGSRLKDFILFPDPLFKFHTGFHQDHILSIPFRDAILLIICRNFNF